VQGRAGRDYKPHRDQQAVSAAEWPLNGKSSTVVERKAFIFNIQKYNMYDGPGVRTLIFFKGCPLRCKWCSNPESQMRNFQVMYKKDLCVHCGHCARVCPASVFRAPDANGWIINHEAECVGCRKCGQECPVSALGVQGEYKTISELMDVVMEDKAFYDTSGGGLTVGGGEPMLQPEALVNLLLAAKQNHVNTAIETCGYARPETVANVAEVCDLFLFDLKHMHSERHHDLTGVRNEGILENLRRLLDRRCNVKVRMPLLRGVNDNGADLDAVIGFLTPYKDYKNFKGMDLLPYHKLGVHKYAQLGREYPLKGDPALGDEELQRTENRLAASGFPVAVIRH
jgi:pyruvate formate lyase activating enzyme